MAEWKTAKRFWTSADVREVEGGYTVELDGRPLKTPAKTAVVVPTLALAEAIAKEWDAQGEEVDPMSMPVTRCANSALDKVAQQHGEVADMLAEYGGTDLLCYRAEGPQALVDHQAEVWDPILDWAAEALGARLVPVSGVMFQSQDADALEALRKQVHALDNFELAAFHDLVALSGSLVLGFAALHDLKSIEELWSLSRVDESWQEQQWGVDEEAQEQALIKETAFKNAYLFYCLRKL